MTKARFDKFRQINRYLEFIDMEHTPKNLLIRAVKKGSMRPKHSTDIRTVEELLHVAPTLDKLLNNK